MPFKDDKPKDAENTDFEARSDSTPMAMQKASPSSTVPLMVQSLNWIYRGVYKFHVVGFGVLDEPRKTGDHTGSPLLSIKKKPRAVSTFIVNFAF